MGHLVVVRSSQGGEGKTLIAHLLVAYLTEIRADWRLYATGVRHGTRQGLKAHHYAPLAITETSGQVALVDSVLRRPDAWTVVDLAHADDAAFVAFADITDLASELRAEGVRTLSLRVHRSSLRRLKDTFWPDSLIDATEVLVLNGLDEEQMERWRRDPAREELARRDVPELVVPAVEDSAVRHFLLQRQVLPDYLLDRSSSGVDVFARVQLAKLVASFHAQFSRFLVSRDLARIGDVLYSE